MDISIISVKQRILVVGDIVTLALVTFVGFASHGEAQTAGIRMLTTFIPLVIAWLLIAPHLKAFESQLTDDFTQLWRPFWAMVLAGPMAAWLRGVLLGTPVQPIFVVVIGGISALALLAWRGLFWAIIARKR